MPSLRLTEGDQNVVGGEDDGYDPWFWNFIMFWFVVALGLGAWIAGVVSWLLA